MKISNLVIALFCIISFSRAQKPLITKSGQITFFSHTVAEDVEATNNQVYCTVNTSNGKMQFAVLIKGFTFENALMQKHFNEPDYLNSNAFPKSTFVGSLTNLSQINFNKNGSYTAFADGILNLHGVSKKIQQKGTIVVADGKVKLTSKFIIKPKNFKIDVPEGISEEIEVSIVCDF